MVEISKLQFSNYEQIFVAVKLLIIMCTIGWKFVIVFYTVRIVGQANEIMWLLILRQDKLFLLDKNWWKMLKYKWDISY